MSDLLVRDPETVPLDCGMYVVMQQCREVLDNVLVVARIDVVLAESYRDYRRVFGNILHQADLRGYPTKYTHPRKSRLENLWNQVNDGCRKKKDAEHRFADIICEAIWMCETTDKNIF